MITLEYLIVFKSWLVILFCFLFLSFFFLWLVILKVHPSSIWSRVWLSIYLQHFPLSHLQYWPRLCLRFLDWEMMDSLHSFFILTHLDPFPFSGFAAWKEGRRGKGAHIFNKLVLLKSSFVCHYFFSAPLCNVYEFFSRFSKSSSTCIISLNGRST